MTALLMAKYGNFNQSILLTNLAYDVALSLRTAQTYGLSVQGVAPYTGSGSGSPSTTLDPGFLNAYGVDFCAASNCGNGLNNNTQIIFFADTNSDGVFDANDTVISTYAIKHGAIISQICLNNTNPCDSPTDRADVTFLRPNPDAFICWGGNQCVQNGVLTGGIISYLQIQVRGTDGSTRTVTVQPTGQISVLNY